jgi:hypothetical protein
MSRATHTRMPHRIHDTAPIRGRRFDHHTRQEMNPMHRSIRTRRGLPLLATLLAASTLVSACKDDDHDDEPEVATMRLTIGATTINVNQAGQVAGGPVSIPRNTATPVTAQFLRADGSPDPAVNAQEFELSVAPGAGITFTRGGPFNGTLTGTAAGQVTVRFGLFHRPENHNDFGPFPVVITVQ